MPHSFYSETKRLEQAHAAHVKHRTTKDLEALAGWLRTQGSADVAGRLACHLAGDVDELLAQDEERDGLAKLAIEEIDGAKCNVEDAEASVARIVKMIGAGEADAEDIAGALDDIMGFLRKTGRDLDTAKEMLK